MLGDIGGFNSAVMIFPAYLMSIYADRMYKKAITEETPTHKRKNSQRNGMPVALSDGHSSQSGLSQTDLSSILNQIS